MHNELHGLVHLLPSAALQLIEVVGLGTALELVRRYPGTHFPVGKNCTRQGKILHAALAEVVGEKEAERIEAAYATQRKLWIPKCEGAMLELRNRRIRARFDELTNTLPAYEAVRELALEFKLVDRTIWRILKELDSVAPPAVQAALF